MRTSEASDGAATLVATAEGALWVRALQTGGARVVDLVATRLDADGVPVGDARLLRRTTGPVVTLSASVAGSHLWVAWLARPDGSTGDAPGRLLSAALHGRVDVTAVDEPVIFEDVDVTRAEVPASFEGWPWSVTRVFAQADGGALVIATSAPTRCPSPSPVDGLPPTARPCAAWKEFRIAPDGTIAHTEHATLAPRETLDAFVELPQGVLYASSWGYERAATTLQWAPRVPTTAPPPFMGALDRQEGVALAWTGDGLAATGALPSDHPAVTDAIAGRRFARFDARGTIVTPRSTHRYRDEVSGFEDTVVAWAPYDIDPLRCVGGHAVVTLRWRGGDGGSLTLDPARPDQRFALDAWIDSDALPLPPMADAAARDARVRDLVWTGRALVGLVDGTPIRWTCTPAGRLVRATTSAAR